MDERNGIEFLRNLRIGLPELAWWQGEMHTRGQILRLAGIREHGWFSRFWPHGTADMGWVIDDNASDGVLYFNVHSPLLRSRRTVASTVAGVDQLGRAIEIPLVNNTKLLDEDGAEVVLPDTGDWFTLIAKYATTKKEPGTLELTAGSTTVTGIGTAFTRYTDNTDARKTKLRIDALDSVAGNEGTYNLQSITSDTQATLETPAVANESAVPFSVHGDFFGAAPADPDCHRNARVVWELITQTTSVPADGLIAYDCMRDTAIRPKAFLIQRFAAQTFRPIPTERARSFALSPVVSTPSGATYADTLPFERYQRDAFTPVDAVEFIGVAPSAGGANTSTALDVASCVLGVFASGSPTTLTFKEFLPWIQHTANPEWDDPGGIASSIVLAAVVRDVALLAIPAESQFTHAVFYATSVGSVAMRLSDDNGQTWGAEATIWNPAGTDEVDTIDVVRTRLGRTILVASYNDGTADRQIRYIYSDSPDLAVWNTNPDGLGALEGGMVMDSATYSFRTPSIDEDDDGNLWTAASADNDHVRIVRGQDVNDPTVNTAEIDEEGWRISPEIAATTFKSPCVIATPDGCTVLMQTPGGGAAWGLHAVQVSRGRIVGSDRLVQLSSGASGAHVPLRCARRSNGEILLVHVDEVAAPNAATYSRWRMHELVRTSTWYGGS